MDESKEKMNTDHGRKLLNPFAVNKPKKRSIVERELETNMTARVTSPVIVGDGVSTSRYGRARRMNTKHDSENASIETMKSPKSENTPVKIQSPHTKQVVSSTYNTETPKKAHETSLDIDKIYQENKSLSCFNSKEVLPESQLSANKFPKVYIRRDLIQKKDDDDDDDIILIKDLFSPKSGKKQIKLLESSSKKSPSTFNKHNGLIDNASVVKALDFDGNKRYSNGSKRDSDVNKRDSDVIKRDSDVNKRDSDVNKRDSDGNKKDSDGNTRKKEDKAEMSDGNTRKKGDKAEMSGSKNALFQVEASCPYQLGELAWARMGTFPFWPCIITRDPASEMFVRKKLFGRVEHYILHVTFFADNGRRSWVVDNMLRKYMGPQEFIAAREKFTPEDKKKYSRLYAAYFVSEKKQSLWNTSVEEAEMIKRKPKRLRIDTLNGILNKVRASKKRQRSGKITRTDSDVSLSESLYDSLFSEDDTKTDDLNRSKNKSRNKSLDVSDVVTACLDNMAAKTGNIKIQKQSHMDRWLQKAKSKTPEKVKNKIDQAPSKMPVVTTKKEETVTPIDNVVNPKVDTPKVVKTVIPKDEKVMIKVENPVSNNKKKKLPPKEVKITKVYSLRRSYESQNALTNQSENDEMKLKNEREHKSDLEAKSVAMDESIKVNLVSENMDLTNCNKIDTKNKPIADSKKEITSDDISKDNLNTNILKDNNAKIYENTDEVLDAINELLENTSRTDSNAVSKQCVTNEKPTNETELEKVFITGTKLEVMDVDEVHEINVKNGDKEHVITDNVVRVSIPDKINFDSPVKTEDSTLNVINGHSPVKIEKEPLIELELESNLDLEAKQDDTEIKNHSSDRDIGETTPPLKRYERVSISENCHLNGDVNNLLTALNKNYREQIDLEDQNSNLSNKSAKKIVTANSTEKEMDQSNADKSSIEKQDISIEKSDKHINKPEMSMEKSDVSKELNDSSIDDITDEDIIMSEKDILNESGNSESILQIGNDLSGIASDDPKLIEDSISISLTNSTKSESILETSKNEAHINYHEMKSYQNTSFSNSDESKPFLDNTSVDCLDSATATVNNDNFFREVYLNKPPDLSPDSVAAKANLLLNVKSNGIDYEEDSDEEPSPEYEPFGKEITEDFRQHMKCIESCITDKKDEKQLVKVCNELAVLEDSKTKLVDIRSSISITSPNKVVMNDSLRSSMDEAQKIIKQERIKSDLSPRDNFMGVSSESIQTNKLYTAKEHINETRNGKIKRKSVLDEIPTKIDLTKATDRYITRKDKDEILDGLNTTKKSIEHRLNSSLYKKKHILSLNKEKSRTENIRLNTDSKEAIVINDNTMNPRYKTIDQIENIIKSKPKRLPLENGEVCIPEIGENNYHTRKEIDTLDQNDDDFDIENASVSSEDSEVSLTQNNVPARRSLRSRPEKKGGLEDPEFLTYMELRQDDLAEEHPELSRDDIVSYLYKTYTYAQNLKSDVELDESPLVTKIKQEDTTPPRKKINKLQIQPKNTIENFFRVKYENAKKIDYGERFESAGTSDSNEDITPKREIHSISPVDSGIGNSKDSNESDTPKRKTKSESPTRDLTTEITKDVKVELMNYGIKQEDTSSPITSKSLRKKTKPPRVFESVDLKKYAKVFEKSLDKRIPIVVISPIKDERNNRIKHKQDTEMKREHDTKTKIEQDKIQCEPDTETKLAQDPKTKRKLDTETKYEQDTETKPERDTKLKHKLDTETKQDTETKPERDTEMKHKLDTETKYEQDTEIKHERDTETKHEQDTETKDERDTVTESRDSDSELPLRQLRSKVMQKNKPLEVKKEITKLKDVVADTESASSDSEPLVKLKPKKVDKSIEGSYEDPEFVKYLLLKEDAIIDDNPQLSNNEIKAYLYKTWIYENSSKSDIKKSEDTEISNLVKGVNQESAVTQKKLKRKPKTEKVIDVDEVIPKEKPKRKTVSHYYNEAYLSDIEDELEIFEIFKDKKSPITVVSKTEEALKTEIEETNILDEIELYFKQLTSPKPSVFKGLIREKVCEICENTSNLIKCKGCNGTFHYDCVNTVVKTIETPTASKGRKKKKKTGRRPKTLEDSENSDERSHDVSEENTSMEDIAEIITIDAATLESHLEAKMKELLDKTKLDYDSYSSDDGIDWADTVAGKCEIVDVKLKRKTPPIDYSNFKCNNCQKHDTPVCFVCKSAVSKTDVKTRQKCNVMHCNNYYHLECLDHWPQTQFNGEWTRNNKKSERFEALTCPRHVCHTCVSDDPRGCKTRFSGDKLARCVRCPATYHSFNKCLPAGSQILTASLIICPRHYEHRPGKVPCHVNTGWCFICALGGSLICCEYCPTSFHAECLNIKPPEGNYMCEDCETGRLPLYGEMVWVKLGHYRWWPGVILHPSEIPDNIMAVTHGLGEFIVRFFGQYDHYWVNRGRVFPFQEGDSGRVSSQRSKIDADFTLAMEHAHKAFEILKAAEPDDEESLDIASSLLPPHYVKLKCNKPIGSLLGRKVEDPSLSLTQCECNPAEIEPCGPHSQCLNRVLLTECGPTCRAGERCNNRAFERRLYPKLTPYKASHRGWGLKTLEDIKAGQFVIEYVGELIDVEEFQRRMTRKHEIRDENFYFLTLDKERMIDAGPKGNLARFMNHCCEPNCETQKWTVLGDVRVGLFAIDDIKANSEVTFNYNLECTGIEKKRCLCGARRCSGYIGAKPKQLDVSQRTKNGALTAKRKHTKRKNIEETPSNKNKVKKPLGRPPKPKELTEIEKDLLIINSATVSNSESSRPQSVEEKQLKPLKSKIVSNSTDEVIISNGNKPNTILEKELDNSVKEVTVSKDTEPSKEKLDCKPLEEVSISNDTESYKALQKKLDFNTIEELSLSSTETSKGPNKPVNRKLDSKLTREVTLSNGTLPRKALKRKLHSMSIEEVSLSSTEPSGKRQKCDKQIEVGD